MAGRALHAGRHRWLDAGAATSLDAKVSRQSEQAIREADVVLVVVDAITGVTEEDSRVAEVVRDLARGKVLLVVNKVDDASREGLIWETLSLGLGDPLAISALHGRGAGDVLDRLVEVLPQPELDAWTTPTVRPTPTTTRSGSSPWRWSVDPTSASPRSSTG